MPAATSPPALPDRRPRLTRRAISAALVSGLVLCAGAVPASASPSNPRVQGAKLVGKRIHVRSDLVVKAKPGLVYRGLLTKGTSIRIERLSGSGTYAYGFAFGHVGAHVWVTTGDLLAAAEKTDGTGSAPRVVDAVLASIPGHPAAQAPFDTVFSTDAPLHPIRDDEGTRRLPGGVGVHAPAASRIYAVAAPHDHAGSRWCYAAAAYNYDKKSRARLYVGHRYPVQIALTEDDRAPRAHFTRKVKTRTIEDAAQALGC